MLKGKTAVVTGSTSGIGLAIARALAGEGANIVMNGLGDEAEIEALRAGIEKEFGVKAAFNGADMRDADATAGLIDFARDIFGGADILVNNAGIQHTAPIEDFPVERWDSIIAINLSAAFHTTRRAVPLMREAGWGRIINIASAHGLVASREKAAYVAAKHGIVGLTKVTAIETGGQGITANAICPGWVFTELIKPQIQARADAIGGTFEEGGRDLVLEKAPTGEFVMPDEIGGLAVFLCSDAAKQITGAALPIDGAWTAQ